MKESIVAGKSKNFAIKIIRLYKYLTERAAQKEFIISKQLLRSGTSIGANVKEGLRGQSVPDFSAKMNIALKEASETEYWIELLAETEFVPEQYAEEILSDCRELIKMLTTIVKTSRQKSTQ